MPCAPRSRGRRGVAVRPRPARGARTSRARRRRGGWRPGAGPPPARRPLAPRRGRRRRTRRRPGRAANRGRCDARGRRWSAAKRRAANLPDSTSARPSAAARSRIARAGSGLGVAAPSASIAPAAAAVRAAFGRGQARNPRISPPSSCKAHTRAPRHRGCTSGSRRTTALRSRAAVDRHPLHPARVTLPLGAFGVALVADAAHLVTAAPVGCHTAFVARASRGRDRATGRTDARAEARPAAPRLVRPAVPP